MIIKSHKLSGLGTKEREVIAGMARLGKFIFRAEDLVEDQKISSQHSNLMLSRLTQKGWLQRIGAGVYRILPLGSDPVNPVAEEGWSIAMELFEPGYIGGWTAAEHWDLTEQIFNTTMVLTGKKIRKTEFTIAGLRFKAKFLPSTKIFGTMKIWIGNTPVQMSDLERTLIDVMDDPKIGGGGRALVDIAKAYCTHKDSKPELLVPYAERLDHGAVFKRLGFIAERIFKFPDNDIEKLHARCKAGIILLDPQGPHAGPVLTRWGLRINIPKADFE